MQTTRFQNRQQTHTHGALNSISIKIILQLLQTEPVSFSIRQNAKQIFEVCIDAPHSNLIYGVQFAGGSNINVIMIYFRNLNCVFPSVKVFGGSGGMRDGATVARAN